MDKFDRAAQKQLLQCLYDAHPNEISDEDLSVIRNAFGSELYLIANLIYLEEHELIRNALDYTLDGPEVNLTELRITRDGIDFIRDDGGLRAILGVMTVKLHFESIAEIERIINASAATTEDKQKFLSQLRSLPADAIKQLTIRLLGQGLDRMPDALQLIQTTLQTL